MTWFDAETKQFCESPQANVGCTQVKGDSWKCVRKGRALCLLIRLQLAARPLALCCVCVGVCVNKPGKLYWEQIAFAARCLRFNFIYGCCLLRATPFCASRALNNWWSVCSCWWVHRRCADLLNLQFVIYQRPRLPVAHKTTQPMGNCWHRKCRCNLENCVNYCWQRHTPNETSGKLIIYYFCRNCPKYMPTNFSVIFFQDYKTWLRPLDVYY